MTLCDYSRRSFKKIVILLLVGLFIGSGGTSFFCGEVGAAGLSFREESSLADTLAQGGYPQREMVIDAGMATVPLKGRGRTVKLFAAGRLAQADTEYRLDQDIFADGTAFTIEASGVTLNLNGHTVTYLNKPSASSVFGINIPGYHRKDIAIGNGRVVQGKGADQTKVGCPPIYDHDASGIDIGGVEIVYRTPDTSGILLHWVSDSAVHHSTIIDEGSVVANRHQGVAAIEADRGGRSVRHAVHHNLIKGARQIGIRAGKESEVSWNEVHLDSRVTNSVGVYASGVISHNRILGVGVHPIGIWPGNDVKVHNNFVEVRNTRRGDEYGDTGAACLRMTWGNDNVEAMNNTFILRAGENYQGSGVKSWGRALWVGLPKPEQRAEFHDNFIMAVNDDGKSKAAAIAVVCNNESPFLVFRNNLVASNWANVLLADSYGAAGGFSLFVANDFVRLDHHDTYHSIRSQYGERASTGVFISNRFVNGASADDIDLEFTGSGVKEIDFGWQVTIVVTDKSGKPVPEAQLVVSDATSAQVASGKTDLNGQFKLNLLEYVLANQGGNTPRARSKRPTGIGDFKAKRTPHTIVAEIAGKKISRQFSVTQDMTIKLYPGDPLNKPMQ